MKKIAVFTSARSEYGLLKPLIDQLNSLANYHVDLLVGGGHLSEEQGMTINEIISDGLNITAKFPFLIHDPSEASVSRSNGLLQLQISDYFEQNKPDLLFVLGDRSELIPVVSSALFQSIPVAHISGGEVTEGATDNQVRHAVSKMSHLHFPATETYKQNLMKMGEEEWRICVSGEPGLDSVLTLKLPSKTAFFQQYGLNINEPLLLATIHSETINQSIDGVFIELLIDSLLSQTPYQLLFTAANTDIGGIEINKNLERLAQQHKRLKFIKSLGKTNYYAALTHADLVLGNSSSGIVEAKSFNIPVVNIGDRQEGRLRNKNVIDCKADIDEILLAIRNVADEKFKGSYLHETNIYGNGNACELILKFLEDIDWNKLLHKKSCF